MRSELEQLKQMVAELTLKNRVLKKACRARRCGGTNDSANQEEKREIIHLVEYSELRMRRSLEELSVPLSIHYR